MSKLSRRWRRLRQAFREWAGGTYELDGCRLTLPSWADDIKRNVLRGNYEAAERRLVGRWIAGDLPVIELGGSFGIVSSVIGSRLGDDKQHLIVEANPVLIDYCRRNAGSSRPSGAPVTVVHSAIAYTDATHVNFMQSDAFLGSRLANPGEGGSIEVPAVTLSALVRDHLPGSRFDLVCDIEGAEFDLLRYDAAVLSACRVAIIEFHPAPNAGATEGDVFDLLHGAGLAIVDRDENVLVARNRMFEAE